MSTYKAIVGKKIKSVSSDPTESADGQMWYNTTTQSLRGLAIIEAWSSAAPLGSGGYLAGSFGTQTAGVKVGGTFYPNTPMSNVEHYNGTGWSEETNMPTAGQSISGAGTQTAGIIAGGSTPSMTSNAFSYNGTAWTAANSLPYAANNLASCGLAKTDVIYAVGRDGSSGNSGTNKSITFDGTNFANGPNHVTTRMFNTTSGAGTGTAALICGGFIDPSPNAMTNCEEYDGTAWSATDTLDTGTGFATAWGTQTNAVCQTNASSYSGSEAYNGTSWSALPPTGATSSGGLYGIAAGATGDAGWLSAINPSGTVYATTVEFNRSINLVTGAAWASGGSLGSAGYNISGCGTQTAGLGFARYTAPNKNNGLTEEYDGSSWSEQGDLSTGRMDACGFGVQTAAVCAGGKQDPGSAVASTEEYGGASWSSGEDLPAARRGAAGVGILTAGIVCGGEAPGITDTTLAYDGTDYSSLPTLNTARSGARGSGTSTAGLICGGSTGSITSATEEYNGSSWSNGGSLLVALGVFGQSSNATQDNSIAFGGTTSGPNLATTFGYDGTAWSTRPNMATARQKLGGLGTAALGLAFGGTTGPSTGVTTTEEFTGETIVPNVETFSTS